MPILRHLCLLALLCAPALAQTPAPQPIQFTEETLPNGLRVVYAPLRQAPVVHVRVLYHVGSRDERPDRQGFAHMFEHMMFRGSAHVATEEHMKRIGDVGGNCNAYTGFDQTVYVNTLPSQYLQMALWLEADRMASFKVSDEIYKTERNVVAEEWRMRQNQPYANVFENFLKTAFTRHSYRWTPIGDMEHLRAAPASALQEFFNRYYVPNNAVLVIAGDFDPEQARRDVERFFGWIPRSEQISRNIPAEPQQTQARVQTITQPVPLPAIVIGYHLPPYTHDDHYPLELLSSILSDGDSSRLQRTLVHNDDPVAVQAYAMHVQMQDAGIFGFGGVTPKGKQAKALEDGLVAAVNDVLATGVTEDELRKARNLKRIALIHGQQMAEDLASQLGDEALLANDPDRVNAALAKYDAVTVQDIKRVANAYLQPQRATTLRIQASLLAAAAVAQANQQAEALKEAAVAPATKPIEPRVREFPRDYPTTAPSASPRPNPPFAKGEETNIDGVKVIVMSDHRLPLVNFSLTMRRGSQSDPPGKEGTAWLTSELMRRGVEGSTFTQLSQDLDSRGINITVGDGGDNTRLSGACTADQLEHAVGRARQILWTPTFPADEFAKLKEQSLNTLRLDQENPGTVANNELNRAIFGETILGRYATPKSVESITLDDVKRFHQAVHHITDAIFIISGDVTVERGREMARKLLAGAPAPALLPEVDIVLPQPPPARRIILVDRPEGQQATLRMGIRAYDLKSPDKFPGSVAGQILSAGIDSRLGKYVRATKGLAYGVSGYFEPNRQAGTFEASTDTKIESTAETIDAIFKVLADMRNKNVEPAELTESQQRVAGSMVMSMQTIGIQAGYRVTGILNGYPIDYYDVYPQRIAGVTAEDIRLTMNKYVDDQRMTIVVVAPAAAVKEQLSRLGEVKVVPMPARRGGAATQPATRPLKKAA